MLRPTELLAFRHYFETGKCSQVTVKDIWDALEQCVTNIEEIRNIHSEQQKHLCTECCEIYGEKVEDAVYGLVL